jgi:hypothetical protein
MHVLMMGGPSSPRAVLINILVGAGMSLVGVLFTLVNRLLKKAQSQQVTRLWNEAQEPERTVPGLQREEGTGHALSRRH